MRKVYGIDFGTTYSCVTYIDSFGQPVVIRNENENFTTPSVVWVSSTENVVTVGEIAKNNQVTEYENTISFIKRKLGEEYHKPAPFPGGYTPVEITSFILRHLVDFANENTDGGDCADVVITCPAYFGAIARKQLKQAGECAGLNVLRIINEPTAAAVAYGAMNNQTANSKKILVYDLGGGTFDVSIVEVNGNEINVIATGGKKELGGYNWDRCLAGKMLEKYNRATGSSLSLDDNKALFNYFMKEAEATKKILTGRQGCNCNISWNGQTARFDITKNEFEQSTAHLLKETLDITQNLFDNSGFRPDRNVEVLLVGGSSRMPQVQNGVRDFLSQYQCNIKLYNPDQSVAIGAVLLAQNEIGSAFNSDDCNDNTKLYLTDVVSKTYGTGCVARDNPDLELIANLIFRNETLPITKTMRFGTLSANQASVELTVWESDSLDEDIPRSEGTLLDENHILQLPPNLPADSPIDLIFSLNEEGILNVKGSYKNSSIEFPVKIKGIMSQKEIERTKTKLANTTIE